MSTDPKVNGSLESQEPGSQGIEIQNQPLVLVQREKPPEAHPAPSEREWISLSEAAAYLRRAKQTLYNWISSGNGPRRKKEYGRWYFLKKDLDAHRAHNTDVREAFK